MKLLLVMPVTNATLERSFSALQRIKSYLRATMSQERLNSLLTLHIHMENALALSLSDIDNDFVSAKENRMTKFGKEVGCVLHKNSSVTTQQPRSRYLVAIQVGYYEPPVLRNFIQCLLCHCLLHLNGFPNCEF